MNSLSICREILQKISKLIHSESFLESHRVKNRFIRKGLLTLTHIIVYLLYTSKQSMSINLSNIQLELPELKFPKVTKQAVSKARQGILPSLFKELFEISVDTYYNSIDHQKNRYRYQANKAYIIGRRKMFIARFLASTCSLSLLDNIFEGACANRSQIQPGRRDPRKKKADARDRKHFNNRKFVL